MSRLLPPVARPTRAVQQLRLLARWLGCSTRERARQSCAPPQPCSPLSLPWLLVEEEAGPPAHRSRLTRLQPRCGRVAAATRAPLTHRHALVHCFASRLQLLLSLRRLSSRGKSGRRRAHSRRSLAALESVPEDCEVGTIPLSVALGQKPTLPPDSQPLMLPVDVLANAVLDFLRQHASSQPNDFLDCLRGEISSSPSTSPDSLPSSSLLSTSPLLLQLKELLRSKVAEFEAVAGSEALLAAAREETAAARAEAAAATATAAAVSAGAKALAATQAEAAAAAASAAETLAVARAEAAAATATAAVVSAGAEALAAARAEAAAATATTAAAAAGAEALAAARAEAAAAAAAAAETLATARAEAAAAASAAAESLAVARAEAVTAAAIAAERATSQCCSLQ